MHRPDLIRCWKDSFRNLLFGTSCSNPVLLISNGLRTRSADIWKLICCQFSYNVLSISQLGSSGVCVYVSFLIDQQDHVAHKEMKAFIDATCRYSYRAFHHNFETKGEKEQSCDGFNPSANTGAGRRGESQNILQSFCYCRERRNNPIFSFRYYGLN
jgi:hypothetical protein